MNIVYSIETTEMFASYNQSHMIDFCTSELSKLTWRDVAKLLCDGGKIEVYDRKNATMFLLGICDVQPKFNSLVVGLLCFYS